MVFGYNYLYLCFISRYCEYGILATKRINRYVFNVSTWSKIMYELLFFYMKRAIFSRKQNTIY